ncbi:alpha/beta fold hydrolase [Variovorax paradoxus]|uniref:alpha/beta fold hydrolase n=1 Tax=Variovorax paradoxus TaxID=34073 RepID=UPI0029C75F17|nr:alpha/beta fold hydrolase [Variovorax paradoxus]
MNEASGSQDWYTPVTREFVAREFRFHGGEVMPALALSYTVLGNPQGEPVLVLHGTGGTGRGLLSPEFGNQLFRAGQPLDAARHFIVLPDAIGHGGSAKPSDGLRASFPRYNYEDMVDAQYRVVTEALGLRHLRLVLGVSMGGMHTWLWGIRHPRFMDALVPMSSLPASMSGRNWLMRRLLVDAIRNDPQWAGGNYVEQPPGVRAAWEFFSIATNGGSLALQKVAGTRAMADDWLEARRALPFSSDANDLLYQWEASRDYDPSAGLERIRAHLLAVNSADDERNPPETGIAERGIAQLANGRLLLIPASEQTRGHGTVGLATLWAGALNSFLRSVPHNANTW